MNSNVELQEKIARLLLNRINVEVPTAETDLMESGLLDSLTLVELIVGLEEEFNVKIAFDEVEIDNFRSVAKIADFVNQMIPVGEPSFT